jgi:hypothetical protein
VPKQRYRRRAEGFNSRLTLQIFSRSLAFARQSDRVWWDAGLRPVEGTGFLMLLRTTRRVVIAVIGGTVVLLGVAMILLPGPAIVVIPAGLAILATEFAWAKHLLKKMRAQASAIFTRPPAAPSSTPGIRDVKSPDAI